MTLPRFNTAPFPFPKVILGTMTWGEQNSIEEAFEQLDWAFDNGYRFIDTAEMYPVIARADTQGLTEEFIGSWLKNRDRGSVIVASKVAGPGRSWIRGGRFTAAGIRQAVDGSLKRLGTDWIDLYQIHWPCRKVPVFGDTRFEKPEKPGDEVGVREQLEVMADLVREGKIRAVGVSNETPWGVCEFCRTADAAGLPRIVSVQNAYSLANRQFEQALDEVCWREGIALLAYSPLAGGTLTGKYLRAGARGRFTIFGTGYSPRYQRPSVSAAVARYLEIAARYGLTPVELALGFVSSRWFVNSVIIGATSLAQLKQDCAAAATAIPQEAIEEIEAVHAAIPNPAI